MAPKPAAQGRRRVWPFEERPLTMLVTDGDGAVLAVWRMDAYSPYGLLAQLDGLRSDGDLEEKSLPESGWLVYSPDAARKAQADAALDLVARLAAARDAVGPPGNWDAEGVANEVANWLEDLGVDLGAPTPAARPPSRHALDLAARMRAAGVVEGDGNWNGAELCNAVEDFLTAGGVAMPLAAEEAGDD